MTTPRNTTQDAKDDPFATFIDTAFGAGIERQEAAGQRELLASTTLPYTSGRSRNVGEATQEEQDLVALGFVFGDEVPGDDLFREATLPEGWTRVGSAHSMWSYIADERGINRVAIFYKAAFYDRDAFMRIIARPGYDWANGYIYQETKTDLDKWAVLTDQEQVEAYEQAQKYLETAERWEDDKNFPDRLVRAKEIIAKVEG